MCFLNKIVTPPETLGSIFPQPPLLNQDFGLNPALRVCFRIFHPRALLVSILLLCWSICICLSNYAIRLHSMRCYSTRTMSNLAHTHTLARLPWFCCGAALQFGIKRGRRVVCDLFSCTAATALEATRGSCNRVQLSIRMSFSSLFSFAPQRL